MNFNLKNIVRKNILKLQPYASARHEFTGKASVFLDANENAWGSPLPKDFSRYPDPMQWKLKQAIATEKNIEPEKIVLGNGSDEIIDLNLRIFSEPGIDNIIICPPTYGMYAVSANIHNVAIREVPLTATFQLNVKSIIENIDAQTKVIFVCSPNNPTGNIMRSDDIILLLEKFNGIVVVDEAYIDFTKEKSMVALLDQYPNLIVMQTLSKAWGLAGLRLGIGYGSKEIIALFNKVKPPYNINEATQELALQALQNKKEVAQKIDSEKFQKKVLIERFNSMECIDHIYPSDANFLLIRFFNANEVYDYLKTKGIVVRNRSQEPGCENCLRITIGTEKENKILIEALKEF